MLVRWDDVPQADRRRYYGENWRGCAYAARARIDRGYTRCQAVPLPRTDACYVHTARPSWSPATRALRGRLARALERESRYRHRGRRWGSGLEWLRALTDQEIMAMHYVGVGLALQIRAIRDGWSDADVLDLCHLEDWTRVTSSGPAPSFWDAVDPRCVIGG